MNPKASSEHKAPLSEPGLHVLPWPPWRGSLQRPPMGWLTGFWLATLCLCIFIAHQAQLNDWNRIQIAEFRFALYPVWSLCLMWTIWAGWGYGAALSLLTSCAMGLMHGTPAFMKAIVDPLGLIVISIFLTGFPADLRLKRLRDWGFFICALFCGAQASALSAFPWGQVQGKSQADILGQWEGWGLGHLLFGLIFTGSLCRLFGPYIEEARQRYYIMPTISPTWPRKISAGLMGMFLLILFYTIMSTWIGTQVKIAIMNRGADRESFDSMLNARLLRYDMLVASLLGIIGSVAALSFFLRRRIEREAEHSSKSTDAKVNRQKRREEFWERFNELLLRAQQPGKLALQAAELCAEHLYGAQLYVYLKPGQEKNRLQREGGVLSPTHAGGKPVQISEPALLDLDSALAGQVVVLGDLSIEEKLRSHPLVAGKLAASVPEKAESYWGLALKGHAKTLGVLEFWWNEPTPLSVEEREWITLLAQKLGEAIEKLKLEQELKRQAQVDGALCRLMQDLASQTEVEGLLRRAAETSGILIRCDGVLTLRRRREPGKSMWLEVVGRSAPPESLAPPLNFQLDLHHEGPAAQAARAGKPVRSGWQEGTRTRIPITPGWHCDFAYATPLFGPAAEPEGVLVFAFTAEQRPSDEDIALAEQIAQQTGQGLQRLFLMEEGHRQAVEIALFEQFGRALSQHLRISETLEQLAWNTVKIFPAKFAGVFEFNLENRELFARYFNHPNAEWSKIRLPLGGNSLAAECFRSGRTIVSADMNKDPRAHKTLNQTFNISSGVFVPLGTVENRLGVLFALDPEVKEYDPHDVRRLEQIAALATAALERARLHEEVHERAEELALLNEIGAVLVESRQIETSLNRIAEIVRMHFQAQGLVILLPGFDLHLTATAWAGPLGSRLMQVRCPLSENGFPQAVLESDQPVYIADTGDEPKLSSSFAPLGPETYSIIMAPMIAARGTTGVLCMVQPKGQLYSNSDIRRLQAAARLSGSAVERGELGQALQASEARLRDILDGLPALVAGLDRSGHLVSLNAYAEKVLGYNEADVLGRHVFELLINDPNERARLNDAFQNLILTGGRVKDKQATLTTINNKPLKVIVSTEPLLGPDGQLNGLVVMATDMTEKFQLEAQLLQAQKMESVGALAGGMAHDFNNLLAGILGQSALAKAMLNGTDPLYETITKIEGAANRGADLTRKLLTFARKSVMQIKPLELGALVRETSELLAGSLPRKIRIEQSIMPDTPRVLGDTTQLQQVFLNLCVNARDAMPNGGVLTLRLGKSESGEARIEIRDTGTGMSPEVKAHLFEPFFTTKEVGRGTGLGLAVVFGIIKSHSGRIEVESEPGKGTAFIIHLPPESKRAVRPTPPTLPSVPRKPQPTAQ